MKKENTFFEDMRRIGHTWEENRKARLEKCREFEKTCGYDSEEYRIWLAENPEEPFPFSRGANKAYQAWEGSSDELILSDIWEDEVTDFITTIRNAGITEFIYTEHSTSLMANIHRFVAEGCTIAGLYKAEYKKFWGTETVIGIRFNVN